MQHLVIFYCLCVSIVSPGLFEAFDENCDGQLDLAEMVRAVGWICRSSPRQKHDCEKCVYDVISFHSAVTLSVAKFLGAT